MAPMLPSPNQMPNAKAMSIASMEIASKTRNPNNQDYHIVRVVLVTVKCLDALRLKCESIICFDVARHKLNVEI